jgi:hypothetical protein
MQVLQIIMWTPWKALDRLRDLMHGIINAKLQKFETRNMMRGIIHSKLINLVLAERSEWNTYMHL